MNTVQRIAKNTGVLLVSQAKKFERKGIKDKGYKENDWWWKPLIEW